jgi:hypothetical protein
MENAEGIGFDFRGIKFNCGFGVAFPNGQLNPDDFLRPPSPVPLHLKPPCPAKMMVCAVDDEIFPAHESSTGSCAGKKRAATRCP